MKLLILENETYLAQSIAGKLDEIGYECIIAQDIPTEVVNYDAILISSDIYDANCEQFIKNNADSIIIMMISYINDETVNKPILAGARDYILKPFMIDELARKINHYQTFNKMKSSLQFYESYFDFIQKDLNIPTPVQYNPPFIIKSKSQRSADIYAMQYAKKKNFTYKFITLKRTNYKELIETPISKNTIYYITNLEELKKQEKKEFLDAACKLPFVMSFLCADKITFPQVVDIYNVSTPQELDGEIISIKDYIKSVILKFEKRYPDIEIAKKLGMSRKSLWEKRRRYGILHKKNR